MPAIDPGFGSYAITSGGPQDGNDGNHWRLTTMTMTSDLQPTPQRPTTLLTEQDAASYLQLTCRALQAWRYQGRGPQFVKISARAVRYRLEDLETWVETRLRSSTSDPGHA